MVPLYGWDSTAKATRRQFTFYQKVPRNSWYSFDPPRNDESILEPPIGSEQGTPGLGIQHLNH